MPLFNADASSRVGFAGNRIDRQSENRPPDALQKAVGHAGARYVLFAGDRALLDVAGGATVFFSPDAARALALQAESVILLGTLDGLPVLAGTTGMAPEALPATVKAVDLRALALGGNIAPEQLGAVAQARSFLVWHENHRFCAKCGAETAMALAGHRRDCAACGRQHFPRTDPVVIMLAVDGERCLLGRSANFAEGVYSCLAGFMEPGETIEDAVRRETMEEAGIRVGPVRYHASQPWPFPSTLMIGCHGVAETTAITMDDTELEACRWFNRTEVRHLLAGTHQDGLKCPPPFAIAHEILRAFADDDLDFR